MAIKNCADNSLSSHSGLKFAAVFIIAATFMSELIGLLPQSIFIFMRNLTINLTTRLGSLLGFSVTRFGNDLMVNGFAMQIITECTAISYIAILALAIMLYTRHTLTYRLAGVAIASLCLLLANAFRLLATGMIGSASFKAFFFVHEYVWVVLFSLLVFFIWKVWADEGLSHTPKRARSAAVIVACCSITFFILITFRQLHCRVLANVASPLFKLLLNDALASITWDGTRLYCTQGKSIIQLGLFFDISNIAVYVGIMLPYVWRNRKAAPLALLGLVALIVMYAEFIAVMGMNAIKHGKAAAEISQLIGSSVFLALPLAIYWMIRSREEQGIFENRTAVTGIPRDSSG